jgi:hypothetical protein
MNLKETAFVAEGAKARGVQRKPKGNLPAACALSASREGNGRLLT